MKTIIKTNDCIKLGARKCAWDGMERETYKVPLELLHYNVDNGRISTWVSGYRQQNGQDCFDNKNEDEVRSIIMSYIIASDEKAFKKTKNDIMQKGQIVAGAIMEDGTIVAGNRRFTALLKAREETGDFNKYRYFI